MTAGCVGKVLWVDLSKKSFQEEVISPEIYESYLAGVGLGVRLLYDRIPAGADPLGPDNILGFTSGFLCGTGALFMGRWMVMGKSPLTGGWGDANCGGNFAPAIKQAGYDAIFFTGISDKPVYLRLTNGGKELVDATHLWGIDAVETETRLIEEIGDRHARVACIGQAGEKLSLISGIVNDGGRIAARSGLGAVMGSKKLKAVAIAGDGKIPVADAARMKELNKKFMVWFNKKSGADKFLTSALLRIMGRITRVSPFVIAARGDQMKVVMQKYGTIVTNVLSSEGGDSPVKNWGGSGTKDFPISTHSIKLDAQKIIDHEVRKYRCYSCPLGCGGHVEVKDGKYPIGLSHKPEYETCCSLGTLLLNKDLDSVFFINDMLNRAGMDTISAGGVTAFAIECVEKGVLTRDDVGGLDLRWGNAEAIIELMKMMIERRGIGDVLADGVRKAAEKIGGDAAKYAIHAGGQELPMHDSRFDTGFAVSYALEPTPGRHTSHGLQWLDLYALHRVIPGLPKTKPIYTVRSKYRTRDKWILQVAASKYMQLYNAAGGCMFGAQCDGRLPIMEYLNAAGGYNHTPLEWLEVGERIQALRQAFNIKQGIDPLRDYKLPGRAAGNPPLATGPMKGVRLNIKDMNREFLVGMGWDPVTAKPTRERLMHLGLEQVADDIAAV